MLKNRIVVKGDLNAHNNIKKISQGFSMFEIHTENNIITTCTQEEFYSLNRAAIDSYTDVVTIHSPLIPREKASGYDCVTLEGAVADKFMYEALRCSFQLADIFAKKFNHKVGVNVHIEHDIEDLLALDLIDRIEDMLRKLFNTYPMVDLYIENVIPLMSDTNGNTIARSGCFNEPAAIAKYFNSVLYGKSGQMRCYSTLDVCHALVTIRTQMAVGLEPRLSLEEYFEKYASTIKQIHLCNVKNFGYGKGEHGCTFKDDEELLDTILTYIERYCPFADLVLEVYEDDYANPINCKELADMIARKHPTVIM